MRIERPAAILAAFDLHKIYALSYHTPYCFGLKQLLFHFISLYYELLRDNQNKQPVDRFCFHFLL
jgi:hypothetical protein